MLTALAVSRRAAKIAHQTTTQMAGKEGETRREENTDRKQRERESK